MKKSMRNLAPALALTAALTGGIAQAASAETAHPPAPTRHDKAIKMAKLITKELYQPNEFPKGVPVPGLLNGSVQIAGNVGSTTGFENPIILVESHSRARTDTKPGLLDGTWIGIPGHDADGRVVIEPVQIKLGKNQREHETLLLRGRNDTVLEGAAIYTSDVTNGPDALFGFDRTGEGNFASVQIYNDNGK